MLNKMMTKLRERKRRRRRQSMRRMFVEPLEDRRLMAADLQGWGVDAPAEASWGDEVMLEKAQVRNAGNSAAGSFDVEFYLSKDQNGSSDDVRLSRADGPGTRYSHPGISAYATGQRFYPTLKLPDNPPVNCSRSCS